MAKQRAVRADKRNYEILYEFKLMYSGWELDDTAWIARDKQGKKVLLMTDHGSLWDFGTNIEDLNANLKEMREAIASIKQGIKLLREEENVGA